MCIRDSRRFMDHARFAEAAEFLHGLQQGVAAPVSYTHLDVYKRQRQQGQLPVVALEARVRGGALENEPLLPALDAVQDFLGTRHHRFRCV